MTERMKEALFSSLGDLDGLRILDLYAGSGALGLEALSRGAQSAIFVESAREAIVKLRQNIDDLGFAKQSEVIWADVKSTLTRHAVERVDLIFMDPPFSISSAAVQSDLEALVMGGFLSDDGRVVLHRPERERVPEPLGLKLEWEREYGQDRLMVFVHDEEE